MEGGAASPGAADSGPHDQGSLGTCVVYALTTVVAQRMMLKYNKVLDEAHAHGLVIHEAGAHAGSNTVGVIDAINAKGEALLLQTVGKKEALQLRISHGGAAIDFDALEAYMRDHQGEDAQAVVRIATEVGGRAVAAEGVVAPAAGETTIRCKNSWGGDTPYFDVARDGQPAGSRAPYSRRDH